MAFAPTVRKISARETRAVRLFFDVMKTAYILYREKNRENHDIIYFYDQTKGERDEEAREFFLEDVAGLCLSSSDHFYDWCYMVFLFLENGPSYSWIE